MLQIDPKTVRSIIATQGEALGPEPRSDRIEMDPVLLKSVYERCDGWMQRVHEILCEEHKWKLGYSTLTQRCRELGLSTDAKDVRCEDGELDYVKPGAEMQQDTSPYTVLLSGHPTRVTASDLYLRYCKERYLKFYLKFDRFAMKCFFAEALGYWKKVAPRCVIDNTNLAVLRGTGENAVMVPEMAAFARSLGFAWQAHRLKHSNRKGGVERAFWTVETNFFPGREFRDLSDLNAQALEWATVRFSRRPQARTKIVPAEAFEQEKAYLKDLPEYIEPPYREFTPWTDRYGYISHRGNFYWVPGEKREQLRVTELAESLRIYRGQNCIQEYPKVPEDQRGQKSKPPGVRPRSEHPQNLKQDSRAESQRLGKLGHEAATYLQWLETPSGAVRYRHRFIRELEALSRQISLPVFLPALSRAREYGIRDIHSIERIASQILHSGEAGGSPCPWEQQSLPFDYERRPAYQAGCFSTEPEIETYGKLLEGNRNDDDEKGGKPPGS